METGVIQPANSTQAYALVQNAGRELARLDGLNAKRVEPTKSTSENLKTRDKDVTSEAVKRQEKPTQDQKEAPKQAQNPDPAPNVTRGYVINPDFAKVGIIYQETDDRTGEVVQQFPSQRELARKVYEKTLDAEAKTANIPNRPDSLV